MSTLKIPVEKICVEDLVFCHVVLYHLFTGKTEGYEDE
jgi:hypothetical protein